MLAKLCTFSLFGIHAAPVEVEVDISPGALPKITMVGLAEAAVKESVHRIERAMANSGQTITSSSISARQGELEGVRTLQFPLCSIPGVDHLGNEGSIRGLTA
jgi:hypothetical protein